MIQQDQTPRVPPTVINAGFESNLLEGWETAGVVETGGYESEKRLTHPGGNAPVESIQKLSDISNGWYTLKAWVRSSGKQKEAFIALKDCGEEARASVPVVREKWMQVVVSAKVRSINARSVCTPMQKRAMVSFDNVEVVPGRGHFEFEKV
jgi:arabinogalactan endo-1,4-beta-galactosidase